jgi:hypothetical protein
VKVARSQPRDFLFSSWTGGMNRSPCLTAGKSNELILCPCVSCISRRVVGELGESNKYHLYLVPNSPIIMLNTSPRG